MVFGDSMDEDIDYMDVEQMEKEMENNNNGEIVKFQDGDVKTMLIENIDKKTVVSKFTGTPRDRYLITVRYRDGYVSEEDFGKDAYENWSVGTFFAGKKFFSQLVREAKKREIKSLSQKVMVVKRIGMGINTQYVVLDLY